jgi:hypothetical protein
MIDSDDRNRNELLEDDDPIYVNYNWYLKKASLYVLTYNDALFICINSI